MTTEGDSTGDGVLKIPERRSSRVLDKKFHCRYCTDQFSMPIYLKCHEYIHMIDREMQNRGKQSKRRKKATVKSKSSEATTPEIFSLSSYIHPELRSFECYLCRMIFSKQIHLKDHFKVHVVEQFYCDMCDLSFAQRSAADAHQFQHSAGRRWNCGQCKQRFGFESRLKSHELVHQWVDSQPFEHNVTIDDVQEADSDLVSVFNSGRADTHTKSNENFNSRALLEFQLPMNFNTATKKVNAVKPIQRPNNQNKPVAATHRAGLRSNQYRPRVIRPTVIDWNKNNVNIQSDLVSIICGNDVEMHDDNARNLNVTYTLPKDTCAGGANDEWSRLPKGFQPTLTSTPKKKKIPRRSSAWV